MINEINLPTIKGTASETAGVDKDRLNRAIRDDPQKIKTLRVLKRKNIAVGQGRMRR